ncbi:MAG: chloride channel protein, partial [Ignavibacteriaceae bacterium]|nr:chloride channel protein [Ignavibacteriaceae bacterium]
MFSVIIGLVAGLATVLFHHSIDFFNRVFFEQTAGGLFFLGTAAVIVLPALGMIIQAIMIMLAPDTAQKKGVSEVIKSVSLRGGYIPFKTTLFHFIAPVVCIGSGGTVGPEGPAAQVGGGISSKLVSLLGFSDERTRIFTAAGAGAAIAAIFNTPLGGVFFALEVVLLNDLHTPTFSALILSSVTASAISRILLGNHSVFIIDVGYTIDYSNLYFYAILGFITGILSILFIHYSNYLRIFFRDKVYSKKIPQWFVMMTVGLLVGVSGYFYKEIFGIGYFAINEVLTNSIGWKIVVVILVLKFLLVPLIINSGGFGGLFAPSLFMGACIGYLFSFTINAVWGLNLNPTIMILVGMGAMLGGVNSIPISAILIIFEMTQNYSFILPLMLAVIISNMFVQVSLRGSVHVKHLEEEGFNINESKDINLLRSIRVSEVELEKIDLIHEDLALPKLMSKLIESPNSSFYTVNSQNIVSGIIAESELRPIITEYEMLKDVIVARDIANPKITIIQTTDDLDYVMNLFGKLNLDQFPVVNSAKPDEILGAITRQKVLSIYNHESLKVNLASGFAKELKSINLAEPSQIAEGYSIVEQHVPSQFVGKSLAEIRIRNKFGLEVLMIKHPTDMYSEKEKIKIITPDPEYK